MFRGLGTAVNVRPMLAYKNETNVKYDSDLGDDDLTEPRLNKTPLLFGTKFHPHVTLWWGELDSDDIDQDPASVSVLSCVQDYLRELISDVTGIRGALAVDSIYEK